MLVREQRREMAKHVRQNLPVFFFRDDIGDGKEEGRDRKYDAVSWSMGVVGNQTVGGSI
jgi:hypothetical protein